MAALQAGVPVYRMAYRKQDDGGGETSGTYRASGFQLIERGSHDCYMRFLRLECKSED